MNHNLPKIEELLQSFARVYNGSEPLKREYDLLEQSKQLNMVVDDYRRLYEIYCQQQSKKKFTPLDVDSPKWVEALKYSFTKLEEDSNEFINECKITQNAINLGILPDTYRNLYESYLIYHHQQSNGQNQTNLNQFKLPSLENIKNFLSKKYQKLPKNWAAFLGLKLLQGSVLISVLVSGINYVREAPERQKQAQYQAWLVVNSAREQQTSGGRIRALEDLNKDKVSLEGLNAKQANLENINLKEAKLKGVVLEKALLREAHLEKANLQGARLQEAILWGAKLRKAELQRTKLVRSFLYKTDLFGAKLEQADLREADLREADFREADLKEADLKGANLKGANLRGARNLTPEQVKDANNWDKAQYDPNFRKQLNLPVERQVASSTYLLDANNPNGIRIFISKGDVITAAGKVNTNPKGTVPKCDVWTEPKGIEDCNYRDERPELQNLPFMALIGEFNGEPYRMIGEKYEHRNNPPGILVLKVNDWVYEGNVGYFKITVTRK